MDVLKIPLKKIAVSTNKRGIQTCHCPLPDQKRVKRIQLCFDSASASVQVTRIVSFAVIFETEYVVTPKSSLVNTPLIYKESVRNVGLGVIVKVADPPTTACVDVAVPLVTTMPSFTTGEIPR